MKILVAHPGSQHARYLVSGLLERGQQVRYETSLAFGPGSSWKTFLPEGIFAKRFCKDIPDSVICRHPLLEPTPPVLQKLGVSPQRAYAIRNKWFQRSISNDEIRKYTAVVGFDTSSKILAKKCRDLGIPFFLELTTVHPNEKSKWLDYISKHYPEWPHEELKKSPDLVEDENDELHLATAISAAASYVKRTYIENTGETNEITINPFGSDLSFFKGKPAYNKRPVFLFLGVMNAAKGLPVLLDAWRMANLDAELLIGGYGEWPRGVVIPKGVKVVGRIARDERQKFFHSGDVFLSPSLYEGFGIVQLEAAACGLAVVATVNGGGPEVLEEGSEGFFIEAGNANALATKLQLLASDRPLRESMGRRAAVKAQSATWDAYARRWMSLIENVISRS